MRYKAIKSFSGVVSMVEGEVKEISDLSIVRELLECGYIKIDDSETTEHSIIDKNTDTDVSKTKRRKGRKK